MSEVDVMGGDYRASDERRWRIQSLGESAICITEGSKPPADTWVVPESEAEALRQQLEGAVGDAATGRALMDRMFELPRGPEWEQALAELRVWCMDPQQLRGR